LTALIIIAVVIVLLLLFAAGPARAAPRPPIEPAGDPESGAISILPSAPLDVDDWPDAAAFDSDEFAPGGGDFGGGGASGDWDDDTEN
jgi:hypothetical protein